MEGKFIAYFSGLREKDVLMHSIESVALCVSEHVRLQELDGKYGPIAIPDCVAAWAESKPVKGQGLSRRTQPLLRALLEELSVENYDVLKPDELRFLLSVDALMAQHPGPAFSRLSEYLKPHISRLHDFYEAQRGYEEQSGISKRLEILTSGELLEAPGAEINKFAGIKLHARGPLYRAAGTVKVVGNVPDQCMLVVESGALVVEGFVFGRVATFGDCDVQENIAGVTVVREGDIRARNIVDHAYVVAKRGSVRVRKILRPKLVFGGTDIQVAEEVVIGTMTSPSIRCEGNVLGGLVHVTGALEAAWLRQDERHPLDIVCRNRLTCEDFGEELAADSKRVLGKAARIQNRIREYEENSRVLSKEAEESARMALYYLSGQRESERAVEELERDQRRLAALNRTILGVHMLSEQAQENLYRLTQPPGQQSKPLREILTRASRVEEENKEAAAVPQNAMERMGAELSKLLREFADPDITRDRGSTDTLRARRVLAEARLKLQDWINERNEIRGRVAAVQEAMAAAQARWERALQLSTGDSNPDKLKAVLRIIDEGDPKDPLVARARSPFVALMSRTIEGRTKRARDYRDKAFHLYQELAEVVEELRRDYQIDIQEKNSGGSRQTEISGRFSEGVRIVTETYMLEQEEPPPGSAIVTRDTGDSVTTYKRSREGYLHELQNTREDETSHAT